MPNGPRYVFMVSMDSDPDKEALFNEVYDHEHVPNLLKVPGVHRARRLKAEPAVKLNIGGEEQLISHQGATYCAIYEIDGANVLVSPEWARAGEAGRWPSQVRPFTRNRRHSLFRIL
jgi:hypothetical protein